MRRVLFALLIVTLVAGCSGGVIRPRVEDGIRDALPNYIGPAKEYKVRCDGDSTKMIGGKIERLYIEGKDVQVDPNLLIGRLIDDMDQVRFHPTSHKMKSVEATSFEAVVSEKAVNRYIEQTRDSESQLGVELQPGKILVKFVPNIGGMDVLIAIAGTLSVAQGGKVNFEADKASVAHLPIPALVANKVLDRVNPVLDMSAMKFPVMLSGISINKGSVSVKGTMEFNPGD
ncbi:MAG TPA: DUF2993 domain-containing protein [Armatimonadota bacterium]|nr:DUF2993 domain-containing protein [Armatimonadota bacterium]